MARPKSPRAKLPRTKTTGGDQASTVLALLKAGKPKLALARAKTALRKSPDDHGLLQVAGIAALQLGEPAEAADFLAKSLEINPRQPGLWEIYGGALESLQRQHDALAAYTAATTHFPDQADGHKLRGTLLQAMGRFEDARMAFGTAADLNPGDADIWFNKGVAEFALGECPAAAEAFDRAIALKPDWAKAWVNRASTRAEQGLFEAALDDFNKALELDTSDAGAHRQLALALWELHHIEQAESMFKKSLELEPDNADTLANLASMYEQTNRLDEAAARAGDALAVAPDHALARRVKAVLTRRSGDAAAALAEVTQLAAAATARADKESLNFELARLHEKLGNADDAYAYFAAANALQMDSPAGRRIDPARYLTDVEEEARLLTDSPPVPLQISGPEDTPPDPVFLIGFPRSGTTLLDQVLDSHPDVVVMDERPPLADVHDRIRTLESERGQPFTSLDEDQRQVARRFYFDVVRQNAADHIGKVLIDKQPLGGAKIRIIQLLFPRARIVFALRHPCDVVLSCFMQRFTLNKAMVNFATLSGAVDTYAAVMGLWRQAEKTLDLPVHRIRYENVVADFDQEISALLGFLDVPWDDRVKAFHTHALHRHVRTASSSQVTQPLYTSAVARWQRYATHLAPHMNTLRPLADAFGYDTDITE